MITPRSGAGFFIEIFCKIFNLKDIDIKVWLRLRIKFLQLEDTQRICN